MKKFFRMWSVFGLTLIFSLTLFSNGLNLNGIGTRASGMGTAYIGLSDDFSAVFFNPAGLTQMEEANLSLFITDLIPTGTYEFPLLGIDAQTESLHYPSGAIGYFHPISDKLVIGLSVYVPSASGGAWNGDDLLPLSGVSLEWESKIFVVTVAPAIAYKVSDTFSLGATLNLNYGVLDTKKPTALGQYTESISGISFGATFGALFKPSDKISLGVSLRTPSKITLDGDANMAGAPLLSLSADATATREATYPLVAGAGIAIMPTNKLTLVFDVVFTQWSELDTIPVEYSDAAWNLFFAADSEFDLRWEDTWQIKAGLEYQLNDNWALRAGYYNDPAPSPIGTQNILLPNIDYNGFCLGFGYKTSKMALDFAVEIVMGKDRNVPLTEPDAMPGIHGMNVIVPNISFTYFLGKK